MSILAPALRAIDQFHDPVFLGVVLHSVVWTALAFVGLAAGVGWAAHAELAGFGWLAWAGPVVGGILTAMLALFLFLPLATVIATLFVDRIAEAVERRWYPFLPPAHPAPLTQQVWDGVALGLRVLAMQVVALVLALLVPGLGWVAGWVVSAWAIGRGLFVAVAMRRMNRATANALYRRQRFAVLAQGGLMTAGGLVPLLNLVTPVLGTAAMVHVLHGAGDAGRG